MMSERLTINLKDCGECSQTNCRIKAFAKWLNDPERDLPTDFDNLQKDIYAFVGYYGVGGSVRTEGKTITIDADNPCESSIIIKPEED